MKNNKIKFTEIDRSILTLLFADTSSSPISVEEQKYIEKDLKFKNSSRINIRKYGDNQYRIFINSFKSSVSDIVSYETLLETLREIKRKMKCRLHSTRQKRL
jgi:KaiC/GvpD/RAD55 family RecA-like ATPase